ncbi:MAG: urease accessory protein UreD [Paracoccaceae bacterium]
MQRTRGRAHVGLIRGKDDRAVLRDLHQSGSAKAILPRVHSGLPEIVFLNTAGGLTGGDVMRYGLDLGAGARAVATTQTAERAYQSSGGQANLDVSIQLGAGARLDWLPQETILFEGASLRRETRAALAGEAEFLMVESVVLGRAAMGETLENIAFHDLREVKRDGRPVMVEPLAIDGKALARRSGVATFGDARAFATIALIARGAEDGLGALRTVLDGLSGVETAASGWDGKLIIRVMAQDGWPLRRAVAQILTQLRGCALPRVWQV